MNKFRFTRYGLSAPEAFLERFFEILPGLTSWTLILGISALAFFRPLYAAILVIVYDFYWLLRLFYITIFLLLASCRLALERETDWLGRVRELGRLAREPESVPQKGRFRNFKKRLSNFIYHRHLNSLIQSGNLPPPPEEILHLIIIPVSRETKEILEPGIVSFLNSDFPSSKMIVAMGVEGWADSQIKEGVQDLARQYKGRFRDFTVSFHPRGERGEAHVKGANVTYVAKNAAQYFKEQEIPFDRVIVSCFDADTVVSKSYFSCLTYNYLLCPNRDRASFQPIPVYHNNIWDVPGFARVLEIAASFFQLTEATNPDMLVTFSSHSMSFKALVEVGYWPVDMISDDSAIFWKAYLHFDGDYRVVPMYITLSMDVVQADSLWKTAVNVYKQKRRWAWGIENFPIVMRGFLQSKRISWHNKFRLGIKLFENHVAWATWPFLLTFVSWLPALFAGREFSGSVLYYNAPRITGIIFNLATVSLLITIVLSVLLLPKKTVRENFFLRILHAFEWLLVPAIAIFFSALPALDAQTRLMSGKYMEFWITEKKRMRKTK